MRRMVSVLFGVIAAGTIARGAEEVVDRVVAVAGRDVILQSEVDEFVQLQMLQSGRRIETITDAERQDLRCTVLRSMVDDRLIVFKAREDSVEVTAQEVEDALRTQLDQIKSQFPTQAAYEDQLTREGTTERELRSRLRTQMERYLLRERLLSQMGQKITPTFRELEQFYETHRDSMPMVPATVTLAHITRISRAGDSTLALARQKIAEAQQRIASGQAFDAVARDMSEDPGSAPQGGDLGWFGRGEMVPEFEAVAFSLDSGAVSNPVVTEFGVHLIQNLGFQGDKVHARHILARAAPGDVDRAATRDTLQSVYRRIRDGGDFTTLAREYSQDPNVQQSGGRVGPVEPDQLPTEFTRAISSMNPGEVSEPFESTPGSFHIVKLIARTREHQMNLTDDRRRIEEAVRNQKLMERLQVVLDDEREKTYVDVRMPECPVVTSDAR